MKKFVLTLTVGFLFFALQQARAADRDPAVRGPCVGPVERSIQPIRGNADCSRGTVEQRLDCLKFLKLLNSSSGWKGKSVSVLPVVQELPWPPIAQ